MFAYKLFSSVGLKWCPKANREQVGFWGMNPPNSFTVKINQFKLFRSSQQHINIYAAKLTLPRTLHVDFCTALKFREEFSTHVHAVPSNQGLPCGWQQASFPAPQAGLDDLLSHPCSSSPLWSSALALDHPQRPVNQPFAGFVRPDIKKF